MAQYKTNRKNKLNKILELKNYIEKQKSVLHTIYLSKGEPINFDENQSNELKRIRKVLDTLDAFKFEINPKKYTISIDFYDGHFGNMRINNVDIDSQVFCFCFMNFFSALIYRIMAVLQYYSPSGWCLNEFWKTRQQLQILTLDIFGYYGEATKEDIKTQKQLNNKRTNKNSDIV